MIRFEALPYRVDAADWFEAVVDRPWAVYLDSGAHGRLPGRYDIVAAEPWATLVTRGDRSEIRLGAATTEHADDPFVLLGRLLEGCAAPSGPPPFRGGAIGYFGYDLAWRLERLPTMALDDGSLPELAVGLYGWALVADHLEKRAWLVADERRGPSPGVWEDLLRLFRRPPARLRRMPLRIRSSVRSNVTREQYAAAFARTQRYIRDGDCYQINLAQRFEVDVEGDPWAAYRTLRALHPAPHGAYLDLPFARILSVSPERFLQVSGGHVTTQPIKGTRPRAACARLDAQRAAELAASAKDRAENVMIVDLLRNDLARNCRVGSVRVPALFEVRSYPSVHHLVSTVSGELAPGRTALDLLRGCFPGGSITGAPKVRAMQIIEELEPHRRGVYCGAIGYVGSDGTMDTNIAIRTLVHSDGRLRYWAGGGLVADSVMEDEYQETLAKAAPFRDLVAACKSDAPAAD